VADCTIRPVRAEDTEQVNEIRRQPSVMEFTTGLPSERIAHNRGFIESFGADDHVFVAEVDGRVVGMAGLHVATGRRRHSAVVGIMVHDAYQGRGIGPALMDALLDMADNYLGLTRVELEVDADNARAIRLYERLGFEHEGRKRKDTYRRGEYFDVLVMGRLRG
jgi:L-phenylalanine/L-methionine N-acetyltransferase